MIELGQEVFTAAHTPFDRGDLHPDEFTRLLLATVAEAQQRGLDVQGLVAPIITPADAEVPAGSRHQDQLASIQHTLAEAFTTPDRLLLPEDFGIVPIVNKAGAMTLHVILTASTGLYRGSYDTIMSHDEEYIIEVGGKEIDTRNVMTRRVHRAMSVQALGKYLSASAGPAKLTSDGPRMGTWYTGDRPNALQQAPFGYDADIYPDRHWWGQNSNSTSVRFRPGIKIIEDILAGDM